MTRRQKAAALPILENVFVSDERKAEIRARLKRLRGQVEGLDRMLTENRPCLDILTQVSAAQEALRAVGRLVVRNYLERCAAAAIKAGKEEKVYDELMEVIFKLTR
jgi:DNA-binding FrmR family transcriptional regulator